jgi:putative membrane protein
LTDATNPNADLTNTKLGPSQQDITFVQQATVAGLTEVTEGNLATMKSENTGVINFGNRMVMDHTAGNEQLTAIANQEGIPQPTLLPPEQQSEIVSLQSLGDPQFSRTYITGQVNDHVQTLMQFIHEAHTGQDTALVAFAQEQIPVLVQHLEAAVALDLTLHGQPHDFANVKALVSSLVPDVSSQACGSMAGTWDHWSHMSAVPGFHS